MQSNNWGGGLPRAAQNQDVWPVIGPALADPNLKPRPEHIRGTFRHMLEMLTIRKSTHLFRLRTAAEIHKSISFYNVGPGQIPGLIVERIADTNRQCHSVSQAVVLVNARPDAQTFADPAFRKQHLYLHPVQAASHDPVVRTAKFNSTTGEFKIPARTAAVFIAPCRS